jgi:hypothetical protein
MPWLQGAQLTMSPARTSRSTTARKCRGVWLDRGEPAGIAPCMVQPDPRPLRGGKGPPVSMSVIDVSGGFKRSAQLSMRYRIEICLDCVIPRSSVKVADFIRGTLWIWTVSGSQRHNVSALTG